jgi:nitrite reductase/ring-hydroxylating ferredoxin subunit
MGGKVEKGFMSILSMCRKWWERRLPFLSKSTILVCLLALLSCTSDPGDDPIPPASFPDEFINLNLPDNIALRSKGSSRAYNDIGVRGVIVYCVDVGIYHAYERNCSYQPNEACATVNIDVSTLFMVDPCCGSTFDFNTGMPSGGVAWRPLRQYRTTFNGTDLIISDEIVE